MERILNYKRTGTDGIHGFNYEYDTTCLAYLRCEQLYKEFRRTGNSGVKSFILANNVSEFCPLDDVVIKVEYFSGDTTQTKLIFVQCKHVANPEKNQNEQFNKILGKGEVQKYFDTFLNIYKRFQSAQSQNESNAKQPSRDFFDFFSGKVTNCEFVMYTNVKDIPSMFSRFELVKEAGEDNITKNLLTIKESNSLYRLKEVENANLICGENDKQLREIFCKNFTVVLNQDGLEGEMKSILQQSEQHVGDCSKYFREEVRDHFNLPGEGIALSEESDVVKNLLAYVTLKSQSEAQIRQFNNNGSFDQLFSVDAIHKLEEKLNMPSDDSASAYTSISTKFMELETRKIIQYFKISGEMNIFIINNKDDEKNWYLARETKKYSKRKTVNICSKISMEKPLSWKPNETFVQISFKNEKCDPIAYFNTLSSKTEQILLSSEVCFQGKHQELGQCTKGKWKNLLDEKIICKMLEDKHVFNIGDPLPILDFYIDRKFKIRTINATKSSHITYISDAWKQNFKLLLFSERNKIIPSIGHTFVWFESITEARNMMQSIPDDIDDVIHLCAFSPENNLTNLELVHSLGRKSKLKEITVINADDLLRRESSKNVILSDIAGMGKTTTLKSITHKFKQENPSYWAFFLELNKYLKELGNDMEFSDKVSAVNFVATKLLNLKGMDLKMFIDACIDIGNVVLSFDAFDEISPDAEKSLPKLLNTLEETKIKRIFVSSRPNFARSLEQKFYQNSIEFIPFTSEDKEKFLLKKWRKMMENQNKEINVDETQMEGAIKYILHHIVFETISIEELLGIPLQMRMIGEIYFNTFISLLESQEGIGNLRIDLYSLYDKFISLHTIRYRTEKEGIKWENITEEKKNLLVKEKLNGVQEFSANFVCPELKKIKIADDNVRSTLCNEIGLLTNLKPPVFLHRTIAEFLAAKYLVRHIVKGNGNHDENISSFFHESLLIYAKYRTLRIFVNATFGHHEFKFCNIYSDEISISIDDEGNTALHIAALEGNIEILTKLLKLDNYNINDTNHKKQTPVLLACTLAENSEAAKFFLDYPACQVDVVDNIGNYAIHYASQQGLTDIIKILHERDRTLLNKQNKDGETPLHLACWNSNSDVLKQLLTFPECQVNVRDFKGKFAIHYASQQGHNDKIKFLLDNDITLLNKRDKNGNTPLHMASKYGKSEAVEKLITYPGCQLHEVNNNGEFAIHIASLQGHDDIIKFLLDGDPTLLNKQDKKGSTPLHMASKYGNTEAVKQLITYPGCQVNVSDCKGKLAINYASEQGHTDIIRILLDGDISQTVEQT